MSDTRIALGALKTTHTLRQGRLVNVFVTLLVGDSLTSELRQGINCVGVGVGVGVNLSTSTRQAKGDRFS